MNNIKIINKRKSYRGYKYTLQCLQCKKEFEKSGFEVNSGRGKFCSHKCYSKQKAGCIPWNKGTKGIMKPNSGSFQIGHKLGKRFEKNHIPWSKGKKRNDIADELHPMWKGNSVGYGALHKWIYRNKGEPKKCQNCSKEGNNRKIHWANKDHKYRRVLEDYISLCCSCHRIYDFKLKKSQ